MQTRPWDDIAKFMELAADPAAEIMVLPYGTWSHRWYGEIAIDERDGQECVANFDADAYGQRIPIEFADHMPNGMGAAGWYKSLRAGDDGVYAEIDWTPKGKEAISQAAYLYHSPECYLRCLGQKYVRSSDRRIYSNLITGDSLTNHPFFKELGPVSNAEFSEAEAEQLQAGPIIFRVPLVVASGDEGESQMFNRKPKTDDQQPGEHNEQPVASISQTQLDELMGKVNDLTTKLTDVTSENQQLREQMQAGEGRLQATQAELAERKNSGAIGALRFAEGKQQYGPKHIKRMAAFMAKLPAAEGSFCAAEGDKPARSMQAEFIEIISAAPTGLVEFGERGFEADAEAVLGASERYEAAIRAEMKDSNIGYGEAMEKVNAAQPELAKQAGIG